VTPIYSEALFIEDMAIKEYKPGAAFPGTIGRTVADSSPAWPEPKRVKSGAPNVIFWIIDDAGYGQMQPRCAC
jgi:hypothetical protein